MPEGGQLALSALGLVALALAAAPLAGAEDLEPIGSVAIDEPFESRDSGPPVSLDDDREATGTVDVPDEATVVEFRLSWPSQDGERAKLDLCFCTGNDCPHEEAFHTAEDTYAPLTYRAEAPDDGNSLAWEAAEPRNVPEDAHVTGQAVFLAPHDEEEPARTTSSSSSRASPQSGLWETATSISLVVGAATATAAWSSPKRWLPPGLAALYHRISEEELLEHPVREAIYELVEAEPGIHFRELKRELDAARGNLQRHLDKLVDADLLSEHGTEGYRCYFVTGTVDPPVQQAAPVLRADTPRRLLEAVLQAPGASLSELSEAAGVATSTTSYHLDRLEDAGLVDRARDGRGLAVVPTERGHRAAEQLNLDEELPASAR